MPKSDKKRKREAAEEDVAAGIDTRLAAYGERFMQMFEPTEVDRRREASSADDTATASSDDDASDSDDSYDISSDEDAGAADAAVERIFAGGAKASAAVRPRPGKAVKVVAAPALPPLMSPDMEKLERKRFMSHKADVVAGAVPVAPLQRGRAKAEDASGAGGLTKEEFESLKREVHMYGASALDKKSKKAFEAAVLEEMGAKKAKGPRVSAKIGLGMAKKQKKREAVAMEEAIAAGMVRVKGSGKKKQAEKRAGLDKGLLEDGGAFRGGVLKVAKSGSGGKRGGGGGGRKGGGGSRR